MRQNIIFGCVKFTFLTLFLNLSFVIIGQEKYLNVQIPPVNKLYSSNECEPSIAINPFRPNEMAAGSILAGYHYSNDSGKTWQSKELKSPYGVWGDPVVCYDSKGRLYYFHLANYSETSWIDRIVCQTSDKIEGDFTTGSFTKPNGSKAQDKHWVVIDPISNVVYMTWTQFDAYASPDPKDSSFIMFSKSIDRGVSWTDPVRISKYGGDCLDSDNTVEGAVPALGKNGEIYVAWSGPRGLVFQKSLNHGDTWLKEERTISKHTGGWEFSIPGMNRANGLPFLVSDMSEGKNSGTLYLNWADQKNGKNNTDIWLKSSKDGGETWTDAVMVNQDNTKKHQFFTSIAIDQSNGDLHFVYYDRSRDNADENKTEVVWCRSEDGGINFKSEIISTSAFIPTKETFFGDYLGIAVNKGVVRPIWPRMDKKKITLWTALINLK
jgi:hypothetical protein